MAVRKFIETVEPKALEFLEARRDPATVTGLKARVLTESLQKDLEKWQETLKRPGIEPVLRELAADAVCSLQAKLELEGALNDR